MKESKPINELSNHRIKFFLYLISILAFFNSQLSRATIITSTQSGNFTDGTTWIGGIAPVSSSNDTVVIATDDTVRLTDPITLKYLIIDAGGVLDNMSNALYILTMAEGANGLLFTINGLFTGTAKCNINLSSSTPYHNHINGTGTIVTGKWAINGNSSEPAAVFQIDTTANLNFSLLLAGGADSYGFSIGGTSTYVNMECYGTITFNTGNIAMGQLYGDSKQRFLTIGSTGTINILAGSLNIANGTIYNNGMLTIVGNVNNGGGSNKSDWYNYANSTLNITGFFLMANASASITGHLFADYANNTINYKGSGNQRLLRYFYPGTFDVDPNATYWHLKCSNAGIKSLLNNIIVKGDLTIRNSAQLDVKNTSSANHYNINLKGHWYDSSSVDNPFVERTGTVTFSDTGNQTLTEGPVAETFYNLTISGGGIKSLNNNMIINGNLSIQDSAQLDVSASNYNIDLKGNWYDSSTVTDPFVERTGTVTFSDTIAQTISASPVTGGETFYNLTLSNNTGDSLKNDVTVSNTLNLNDGKIILGTSDLTISIPTGITGYNDSCYVVTDNTGYLQINNITASSVVFPVGPDTTLYNPVTISNIGTAGNFTTRVCSYVNEEGTSSLGTPITWWGVDKTWLITTSSGAPDATVTLVWNSATDEMTGFQPTYCAVNHHTGSWTAYSFGNYTDEGAGYRSRSASGITSFSPFGVSGGGTPLPIELLSFTTELNSQDQVILNWSTATETNNDYFSIERSDDALDFHLVGTLSGSGNSSVTREYSFIDETPFSGTIYYRIKQTDFDGKFSYSPIISINLQNSGTFTIYPNPATDRVYLNIPGEKTELVGISVTDKLGRTILSKTENMKKGQNVFSMDVSGLSNGVYLLQILNISGAKELKKLMINK